ESLKTKKQKRQEAEKKGNPSYPKPSELREEEEEEAPSVFLIVSDASGKVVRKLTGPTSAGFARVTWDLRYTASFLSPARPAEADEDPFREEPSGPLVMPGQYTVSLAQRVDGVWTDLAGPQSFSVVVPGASAMPAADRAALGEFQQKVARLQ